MREFYLEAKAELGYTSSQLRQSPELKAKVDALKYKKLGKWMDAKGASVYKLGNTYAISDHVANNGTVVQIFGPKNLIKGLNGIKIAGLEPNWVVWQVHLLDSLLVESVKLLVHQLEH